MEGVVFMGLDDWLCDILDMLYINFNDMDISIEYMISCISEDGIYIDYNNKNMLIKIIYGCIDYIIDIIYINNINLLNNINIIMKFYRFSYLNYYLQPLFIINPKNIFINNYLINKNNNKLLNNSFINLLNDNIYKWYPCYIINSKFIQRSYFHLLHCKLLSFIHFNNIKFIKHTIIRIKFIANTIPNLAYIEEMILYLKLLKNYYHDTTPEVTSTLGHTTSFPLGVPPEVTTTVGLADSCSNYLSQMGNATPRDRGEGCDGSYWTSSGGRLSETIYGSRGEVNKEAVCKTTSGGMASGMKSSYWTSSGLPVADLREAEGEVNREADGRNVTSGGGRHGEWKRRTSSGGEWNGCKDITSSENFSIGLMMRLQYGYFNNLLLIYQNGLNNISYFIRPIDINEIESDNNENGIISIYKQRLLYIFISSIDLYLDFLLQNNLLRQLNDILPPTKNKLITCSNKMNRNIITILPNDFIPDDTYTESRSNSFPLAESSPPEVHPAVSSSNYLSQMGIATPGDRGEISETIYGSRGEVNREATTASGMKSWIGPQVESETIYGSRGEVNEISHHGSGNESRTVTSGGKPVADLREAKGQLNRGSRLQDKRKTSGRADGRMSTGGNVNGIEYIGCKSGYDMDEEILLMDIDDDINNDVTLELLLLIENNIIEIGILLMKLINDMKSSRFKFTYNNNDKKKLLLDINTNYKNILQNDKNYSVILPHIPSFILMDKLIIIMENCIEKIILFSVRLSNTLYLQNQLIDYKNVTTINNTLDIININTRNLLFNTLYNDFISYNTINNKIFIKTLYNFNNQLINKAKLLYHKFNLNITVTNP